MRVFFELPLLLACSIQYFNVLSFKFFKFHVSGLAGKKTPNTEKNFPELFHSPGTRVFFFEPIKNSVSTAVFDWLKNRHRWEFLSQSKNPASVAIFDWLKLGFYHIFNIQRNVSNKIKPTFKETKSGIGVNISLFLIKKIFAPVPSATYPL